MARRLRRQAVTDTDEASARFRAGEALVEAHPLFVPLLHRARVVRGSGSLCPEDAWVVVSGDGYLHAHPSRCGEPEQWAYSLAHALLHLGFGHFQMRDRPVEWNAACDCFVARFLADLKFGQPLDPLGGAAVPTATSEERLYQDFCERGIPSGLQGWGTAGSHRADMLSVDRLQKLDRDYSVRPWRTRIDWSACLARGLRMAVTSAINVAGGREADLGSDSLLQSPARRAHAWFISNFPLLGALAASFRIVEDQQICARMGISIAAVDVDGRVIIVNPAAALDEAECRFVMAHELLHAGLRHDMRGRRREPYLWNVACDYVINGWLVEMGLGDLPQVGALHDAALTGESAEAIYDRMAIDMRRYRRLATLRGVGAGDILGPGVPDWRRGTDGTDLDEFYRRCLSQGLLCHQDQGRGLLPAELIEEIQALSMPPIPWDVDLAQWFDAHFSPLDLIRSYARPSRRQSATPDIPRPSYLLNPRTKGHTFGVVLDTSGSMDGRLLAEALGAIASYSNAHDVPAARVVFCDADAYDQGYMPPEEIAGCVQVKGRGGTVLQPGIDLLTHAEDFPKDGPVLIITDGYCDRLRIHREHAYLMPAGHRLPFVPEGKVFQLE